MDDDDIDPQLASILAQLWRAHCETPRRAWSLAKLSKQAAVPMSSLRRQLAALAGASFVTTVLNEDGTGSAALTDLGAGLCAELFGDDDTSSEDDAPPPSLH
jgi:hypothetical protein